jgi:hypothetical protein
LHIRYVLLAADLRSFAKAAAFAEINNATLSRHISYLQQKAVLFVRSTRSVVPTGTGGSIRSRKEVLPPIKGSEAVRVSHGASETRRHSNAPSKPLARGIDQ